MVAGDRPTGKMRCLRDREETVASHQRTTATRSPIIDFMVPPRLDYRSLRYRVVLWCLACMVISGVLGACASRSHRGAVVRDTIWYVSARARDERGRVLRTLADTLEYGAAIFERAPVSDAFSDKLSFTLRDSLQFSRDAFLNAVLSRVNAQPQTEDFAVLYVHGFGTGLDECRSHPVHARTRSLSGAPWIAFCWPSHGAGITWPRLGSVFVRAYEDDTASVTRSAPAFRQTLDDVAGTLGADRVLLTTHSLGGRMVSELLARTPVDGPPRDTLRALAFIALDHEATRFADTLLPALRHVTHRIVLYAERRDRPLIISRRMHDSPRAGLADPEPLVRNGLESVNVSDAFVNDSWLQRIVGNRHSIKRASALLWDLTHVVGSKRDPSCRETVGLGRLNVSGVWQMLAVPRPDTAALSRCITRTSALPAAPSRRQP
jgi:pimeloyl-ACP methyl ester carboxylesterase